MKKKFLIVLALFSIFQFSFLEKEDIYQLDKAHTFISFDVERFMSGEVSGRFNEFSGDIKFDVENMSSSQVDIVINVNSLDTNHETRDKHLIGSMWLDAKSYPEIKFISSSIRKEDINKYRIEGSLTIKNITKKK